MTYIALPERDQSYLIARMEEKGQKPVGYFRDLGSPVDLQILAENFASTLNGNQPAHQVDPSLQGFFERHDQGFTLRYLNEDKGATDPAAIFTTLPGESLEIQS